MHVLLEVWVELESSLYTAKLSAVFRTLLDIPPLYHNQDKVFLRSLLQIRENLTSVSCKLEGEVY